MLKAPSTAGDQSAAKADVGRYRSKDAFDCKNRSV